MATPSLESFCCSFNDSRFNRVPDVVPDVISPSYNAVCLASSAIGLIGTILQLLPRTWFRGSQNSSGRIQLVRSSSNTQLSGSENRLQAIVAYLTFADCMACFGLFIRSTVWLFDGVPIFHDSATYSSKLFCVLISSWIHFFYTCTYFWTFNYALDASLIVRHKRGNFIFYHSVGWLLPIVTSLAGLLPLYSHFLLSCHRTLPQKMAHHLSIYLPILFVIIANWTLLCHASYNVINQSAYYGVHQRELVSSVRRRFFLIVLIFIICWSPNLLNGILLLTGAPVWFILALWMYMAVVNPLQALLNSLLYIRRSSGSSTSTSSSSSSPGQHHPSLARLAWLHCPLAWCIRGAGRKLDGVGAGRMSGRGREGFYRSGGSSLSTNGGDYDEDLEQQERRTLLSFRRPE